MSKENPWLDAWHDPVAGLKVFSNCICLTDVFADGDTKLLVADADKRLKIYHGKSLQSEHAILSQPTAICSFFADHHQPRTPSIAVASGCFIYIYRNLRPYYKFTLPVLTADPNEVKIWAKIDKGDLELFAATEELSRLRETGTQLSMRSMDFLALDDAQLQAEYAEKNAGVPLLEHSCINCMTTVKKNSDDWDAVSCIVIGTESKQVFIIDNTGANILLTCNIPGIPCFIAVSGLLDVEYRLTVACRNGKIYSIKNGDLLKNAIELEAQACAIVRINKQVIVGTMGKGLHSFTIKGKKNWSIKLPHDISCIEPLVLKRSKNSDGVLVALSNGDVHVYNDKTKVSGFSTCGPITAMKFGPYAREDASIVLIHKSGAISIKMLRRSASFDVSSTAAGPPPEQDIPLNIPKKTKLYVEQTQRERDQAVEMHRIFQRDLCKLRLTTARTYVKIISEGQGASAVSSTGVSVKLNAQILGIGPDFKIRLHLQNSSSTTVSDIPIAFHYNHELYRMKKSLIYVPVLLSGMLYTCDVSIESLSETGAADSVYVFVCSKSSCVPLVSAVVAMPISEPPFEL